MRIVQVLLLSGRDYGPFCSGHFNPYNPFSTMDLDSDYYSFRCKALNGLLFIYLLKGLFMTFVGGDNDH